MTIWDYELLFNKIVSKIKEDLNNKSNDISVIYENSKYFYEINHEDYRVKIKVANEPNKSGYLVECNSKNEDGNTVVTINVSYNPGNYFSSYSIIKYDPNGTKVDSDYLGLCYSEYINHSVKRLILLLDSDPRLKEIIKRS